ncbi:MAG TPA: 3D domain-containing protein [Aquella sp.]|nr:3D domain-containing protein [Aquella sp.]
MIAKIILIILALQAQILHKQHIHHGYKAKFIVTGYSPDPRDNGGISQSYFGRKLHHGTIAVDPKVIPFGSKIYVKGYGYGWAADVGGAIRGKHIDVCLPSRHDASRWGLRHMTIYIIPKVKF